MTNGAMNEKSKILNQKYSTAGKDDKIFRLDKTVCWKEKE
jgi:hypothetical protein